MQNIQILFLLLCTFFIQKSFAQQDTLYANDTIVESFVFNYTGGMAMNYDIQDNEKIAVLLCDVNDHLVLSLDLKEKFSFRLHVSPDLEVLQASVFLHKYPTNLQELDALVFLDIENDFYFQGNTLDARMVFLLKIWQVSAQPGGKITFGVDEGADGITRNKSDLEKAIIRWINDHK